MTTGIRHLHAKFGNPLSNVAEEDVCGVALIGDFWKFQQKGKRVCNVIEWSHKFPQFLRTEKVPVVARHNQIKSGSNTKSGSGSTAQRIIIYLFYYIQGGPQKSPFFSLAITFAKIRKPWRFCLHSYWKFIEVFWWNQL